jgi:hypothetical protein
MFMEKFAKLSVLKSLLSHGFVMFFSPRLIRFIIGQKVLPTYISNPFLAPIKFSKGTTNLLDISFGT